MLDGSPEAMTMSPIALSLMSNTLGVGEVDGIILRSSLEYPFS